MKRIAETEGKSNARRIQLHVVLAKKTARAQRPTLHSARPGTQNELDYRALRVSDAENNQQREYARKPN